jgi:hypothetical protein
MYGAFNNPTYLGVIFVVEVTTPTLGSKKGVLLTMDVAPPSELDPAVCRDDARLRNTSSIDDSVSNLLIRYRTRAGCRRDDGEELFRDLYEYEGY